MTEPKVSVVIPTYNRSACVGDAINSVLSQTCRDFEVVVVDDGSTDETPGLLQNFGDRIHVIRQGNKGVSEARNTGIREARGEWVAFLDSDDVWTPEKLQIQTAELVKHPTAVGHLVDATIVGYEQGEVSLFAIRNFRRVFEQVTFRPRPLLDVLKVQFFTSTWLLKRSAILQAGMFRPDFKIYEDLELLMRIALTGPFVVSTTSCVKMRRVPTGADSLSNLHVTRKSNALSNLCEIYEKLLSRTDLTDYERRELRRELSGTHYELAAALAASGEGARARSLLRQSVADSPGMRSFLRASVSRFGGYKLWERLSASLRKQGAEFRRSERDAAAQSK